MVAFATSLFDGPAEVNAGVHVTYLRDDGRGKADVPQPKLTFGCFKGAAVYFGFKDNDNSTWVIAEGIETCLSAMTMLRASGEFGRSGP